MKERYDVIVVGAGPSGLLAARAVALNGFDVALIDRKKDLGAVNRTCGQSLLPPNEYFFGDIFHYNERDRLFCYSNSGLSFPYTGPIKKLHTWHMFSPGMQKMQFGADGAGGAPIALSYDKEVLLRDLLKEAEQLGVDLLPETEFSNITAGGGNIMVQAGEKVLNGSCVIAADGANSRVVERLGFNNSRRHIADLHVWSGFIEGFNSPCGESIVTASVFLDDKPVYVFLLPRPDGSRWNCLLLTLEGDVDIKGAYERIAADARYAGWFKGARVVREFAAVESIYSPIIKPFRNNVFIVGDAGACQELECLGAMISGWKGGLAAASALKEQQLGIAPRAVAAYEDWWLNTYIKQYDYQDYLSIFGIAYVFSKPEIIDYIFGLMEEPFAPTFNPYTAVQLLGSRLQGLMPKIMGDRPDILQQLAVNMMQFPADILSRTLQK